MNKNQSNIFALTLLLFSLSMSSLTAQNNIKESIELVDRYTFSNYLYYTSTDITDLSKTVEGNQQPSANANDGNISSYWVAGKAGKKAGMSTLYLQVPIEANIPEGYATETDVPYHLKAYAEYDLKLANSFGLQSFPLKHQQEQLDAFWSNHLSECKTYKGHSFISISETAFIIKIKISKMYKGSKNREVCLSEIFFNNRFVTPTPTENLSIDRVYAGDAHSVMMDAGDEKAISLFKNEEEVVANVEWMKGAPYAVVHHYPAQPSENSHMHSTIIDLKNRQVVDKLFEQCTAWSTASQLSISKEGEQRFIADQEGNEVR